MRVTLALFMVFVFSGAALGKEGPKNDTVCPPTIVDCACTEKDGNFYTIQINMTTVYITDEDAGKGRCVADGNPMAICEDNNCDIIPNNNFATLFRKGKKMSPSNYLQKGDLAAENSTSSSAYNQTDEKSDTGPSQDEMAAFYPIELTYPRMIHGEEASQLVKRDIESDHDSFAPRSNPDFGNDRKLLPRIPQDHGFRDDKYENRGQDSLRSPSDSHYGNENYRKNGSDSMRSPSDPNYRDDRYGRYPQDARKSETSLFSGVNNPPQVSSHQEEPNRPQWNDHPSYKQDSMNNAPANDPYSFNANAPANEPYSNNANAPASDDFGNFANAPAYWQGNYGTACRVPQLRNSEVTCWKWPNWQTCKQTCIYGHGLASPKGTLRSTTYSCRNSENQWKPNRMTDCQPYLNCRVRLRSPGDLKCVEPTNRPAYCDIACEEYDNHSAQKVRVTCDEKQGGMRLPFCATLDKSSVSHIKSPVE